jgi:hypothetical protein
LPNRVVVRIKEVYLKKKNLFITLKTYTTSNNWYYFYAPTLFHTVLITYSFTVTQSFQVDIIAPILWMWKLRSRGSAALVTPVRGWLGEAYSGLL